MPRRRIVGLIAIAAIVLFIVADILFSQSSKAELLYSPDCLCLYSVHRVVFSLKTGKIESLPPSSCRTSLAGFLAPYLIKKKTTFQRGGFSRWPTYLTYA